VLLDLSLPAASARKVAAELPFLHGAGLPIIVITADGRAAEKSRRLGAVGYLHKPFEIDALVVPGPLGAPGAPRETANELDVRSKSEG